MKNFSNLKVKRQVTTLRNKKGKIFIKIKKDLSLVYLVAINFLLGIREPPQKNAKKEINE